MTSLQVRMLRCCGLYLAIMVAAVVAICMELSPREDRLSIAPPLAVMLAASAGLLLYLCVIFPARMRRDSKNLRVLLRKLPFGDKDRSSGAMAFSELQECASELNEVARRLLEQQERLSDGAARDPLTGLPNRRMFRDVLAREVAFAQRTGWPLSLLMVDLDHFKVLNDTHGHLAGDAVLRHTAERLSSLVRTSDVVARYGGEEFVIVFPGTGSDQAAQIAQQLCSALRCDRIQYEGRVLAVTASFGVAEFHASGGADADTLIANADEALYSAKYAGRDCVVVASEQTSGESTAKDTKVTFTESSSDEQSTVTDPPVDRDTMALMGSMFSILQLIPDKLRVARDLTQQVAAVVPGERAFLFAWDKAATELVPLSTSRVEERDRLDRLRASAELERWFTDLLSESLDGGDRVPEPVVLESNSDRRATLRLPLRAYGELLGVIEAPLEEDRTDAALTTRQRAVLTALGAIGAMALHSCELYNALENRWVGLIEALCRAIHSNDAFKSDHAQRVAAISVLLARALGQQDRDELQLIRVAGLVHDIGKVGLPTQLFRRKGRLRPAERRQLEEHCRIGADILSSVPEMTRLADIVLHHHEHFDGGGYPYGLAGAEIPIESRILAVADAYDAMTSDRPFRPALSHQEAVARVRSASTTQFDPSVVNVFLELFESAAHLDTLLVDRVLPADGAIRVSTDIDAGVNTPR